MTMMLLVPLLVLRVALLLVLRLVVQGLWQELVVQGLWK